MTLAIESASSPQSADLVHEFLRTHSSGVLATADPAGAPHAAVVYVTVDEDFCLSFGTKVETQKYKNIEANDQVAFVCYDEQTQTTLQLSGRVEKVEDPEAKQAVLNAMFKLSADLSKTELPPAEKLYAGEYVALKIVPSVIKLAIFRRPDSQGDDLYETLVFNTAASE